MDRSFPGESGVLDDATREALLARFHALPFLDMLPQKIVRLEDGYCEMWMERREGYNGIFDSFHGGLLATLADVATCFAALTQRAPGARVTTTDINVKYLAPCLSDVTAEARVIKAGRTLCPTQVDLYDAERVHVATGLVTYMFLD